MKLLIQPGNGSESLIQAIERAKKSIEIVIFRFDRAEIERALVAAAERGVAVQALIAFTNRGGEKNLRRLELRFLAKGITVCRTADDLVRYHGKMAILDGKELHLMSFNLTHLDIDQSRSFGIVTGHRRLVQEAAKLFDCDCKRQPYHAGHPRFLVSPVNSRERLAALIQSARKELLIYDVEIADRKMIALLEERLQAGVAVRIIGKISGRHANLPVHPLAGMRLHARAIVRDGKAVFLGSQSLRPLELDARREIGIVVDDAKMAAAMARVFESDWAAAEAAHAEAAASHHEGGTEKTLRKMAKAIGKNLPSAPSLAKAVAEVLEEQPVGGMDRDDLKDVVRGAMKDAVQDAVRHVVAAVMEEEIATGAGAGAEETP